MKDNGTKSEVCLFYSNDITPITLSLNNSIITFAKSINMMPIIFNADLNWDPQVCQSISKTNKELNALKLICDYFNTVEKCS
jgi:hypothetical protein